MSVKAHSLAELIALAKANPGKLNFASSGYGLAAHLAGELFKAQAHIDIVHVPYKGSAPALEDVIAGQDQMMFATTSGVMGFLKNGQVRALAVTTLKRTPSLPDVPTMDEAGLPGFEATTWHGLVAPAGTPPAIVAALNKAIAATLNDPDIEQEARQPRHRHRARHAGAVRRLYQSGNSEMGGGDQGVRRQDAVKTAAEFHPTGRSPLLIVAPFRVGRAIDCALHKLVAFRLEKRPQALR